MEKSPEAFRTISEVADWLGVPTHVLRFWESRFAQIKPVKRAGGRRYYRPSDMALIGGIKRLLHDDGMTIRGAQKLLREKGVKHVAALSQPLDGGAETDFIESTATEAPLTADEPVASRAVAPAEPVPPPAEPEAAAPHAPAAPDQVAEEPQGEPAEAIAESFEEEPEEPAVAAAIVAPPDVPDTDPDDDDTGFPGTPGLAARLRMADRGYLQRNRGALELLREKLEPRAPA
ncbi:MAG: MerR family transcriptional regulator [Paracoccaceae bacterium]|nr:MerR family transcriptional regulator [Paracoccaceae bacterium]